jgi:hypothetical protein
MVQNIINQLKLRETCFNKNNFKLRCKQCNSYLNYDIQIKKRVCSQICYNIFYYQQYYENFNNLIYQY